MATRKENDMNRLENEPTGKALDAWIGFHVMGYQRQENGWFRCRAGLLRKEAELFQSSWLYVGDLLNWCQDAPRYWDVLFMYDESYVQRAIEIYDGPNGTRHRVTYTDSAQLPAALCQAIYRAVQVSEKAP